MSSLKQCV